MKLIKAQFLLNFAMMGAVLVYLPLFLGHRLGDSTQVGLVMSATGLAIILTPVLMTFLADTRLQSRWLIAASYIVSAGACVWLLGSFGLIALLIAYCVFSFGFWPQPALQDGLYFALARQRERDSQPAIAYHHVRIFGTIGFAIPLVLLYFLIGDSENVEVALLFGAVLAGMGFINALCLPHTPLAQARRARFDEDKSDLPPHPTLAAARVLFTGPGLVFAIGMFVAHLANTAYYTFYPIYLESQIGFMPKWIGPIAMIGVVIEIGIMLALGFMTRKWSLKGVLLIGLTLMAVRFALLGLAPTPAVAVGTQLLHGMTVISMYVLPPIYLNQLAGGAGGDHFRASIQGLYAMAVFGPTRIIGNLLAGHFADISITQMFTGCAVVSMIAVVGLAVGFWPETARQV